QSSVVSSTIVFGGSERERNLMLIVTAPLSAAAATATRLAELNASVPGRTMTSTPMKPAATALQRRSRTTSPRNSTAPIVTNIGDEYESAIACAIGRCAIAQNPASIDAAPTAQRAT